MSMSHIEAMAHANVADLRRNPYPGRGIVAGLDESGAFLVQIYWIMGRSDNSRNRVLIADNETGRVYTVAADASRVEDTRLIIYNAMLERGRHSIVSNGDQTDTVAQVPAPVYLNRALALRLYEPDAPHFTPRITAITFNCAVRPLIEMGILRKSPFGDACDRAFYEYVPHRGFGHCITTYAGDSDPLPPFRDDPVLVPLNGEIKDIAHRYWDMLDTQNRVSLAVKWIPVRTGRSEIYIINKYSRAG